MKSKIDVPSRIAVVAGLLFFSSIVTVIAAPALLSPSSGSTAGGSASSTPSSSFVTLKPVTGIDDIGKTSRIYYHKASGALFMAVTEKDGLRSVWKRSADGSLKRIFLANRLPGDIFVSADTRGHLFIEQNNPNRIYRSADGGETWDLSLRDDGVFWHIADGGGRTLYGTLWEYNTAVLYRSTDEGAHWEPWKDFQQLFPQYAVPYAPKDDRFKLRHLHGVIVKNGKIYVGTGDVARFTFVSEDKGEHWKPVWDEGFTAAINVPDSGKLLLGPDRLRAHGIALLDAATNVKEVWHPLPYGYAGYTYSMVLANGIFYAGMHNESNEIESYHPRYGIIASRDGLAWYPVAEYGPVVNTVASSIYLAEGKNTMYASIDGSLYTFEPLSKKWFDSHVPFKS